ncbi:uncharacterized protein LOC135369883 [Ornithodoros turicata]|uniref:uncharacterized protein LOC135369883 n=1 Tax=Ornithodoros turicata TaxID=34597 RepID=UPI0031395228
MSRRNSNEPPTDGNAGDSDDNEFGEFEGFEGAVGGVAHPAPSPWATFPDLVRVRTSPGSSSADDGAVSQQGHRVHAEPQNDPPGRTRNPPDVSLSARDVANDDVNLLNFIPNSHQRALPDMAAESELRHINPTGPREAGLHHVAEVRPTRRQCDQSGGGVRLREQMPASPQNHAPYHESNDVLQRRLTSSEDRVRELEVQLSELRAREARIQRYTEDAMSELRAARETIIAHERAVRSLVERVEISSTRSLQENTRLSAIEARLDQLSAQLSSLTFGDGRVEVSPASSASLTKEDIVQAVQEAMSRQRHHTVSEEERRRLVRSMAESFQSAITQFMDSLDKQGGDS